MKNKYLLLPFALLLASCGNVTDSSSNEGSVSVEESSVVDTAKAELEAEIELINNSSSPYTIRDSITIIKDGTIYLSTFSRIEYDSTNGIYYTISQENGYTDLNNPSSYYISSTTIYYDGYDSYTLDSDDMYVKKEDAKEIKDLEIGFDFSLVENLTFKKEGFRNTLIGIVKSSNANTFLSKQGKEISDIEFKSYSNGETLQTLEFKYTQNGFSVVRSVEYTYLNVTLELPKNIKKF